MLQLVLIKKVIKKQLKAKKSAPRYFYKKTLIYHKIKVFSTFTLSVKEKWKQILFILQKMI